MDSEERIDNLACLVFTCNSIDELDEFFAEFNYQFVFARDHLERMEELR